MPILNSEMKKFVVKLLAMTALVSLCCGGIFAWAFLGGLKNVWPVTYQKGFVYQYRALERMPKDQPKVLIIGGSYIVFSIDGPFLEKELGMPVRLLGVHSGMGMTYIFEQARKFINKGDVVIFPVVDDSCAEYGMPLIYITIGDEIDLMKEFVVNHYDKVIPTFGQGVQTRVLTALKNVIACGRKLPPRLPIYDARLFCSSNGFYCLERKSEWHGGLGKRILLDVRKIDAETRDMIRAFSAFVKSKGARFVMPYAPQPLELIASTAAELDEFDRSMSVLFPDLILGSVREWCLPISDFFIEAGHLSSGGAREYSRVLAAELKRWAVR